MPAYIDRRLSRNIDRAGEAGQVEAVIVVREDPDLTGTLDDGGLARQVIAGAVERTGDQPASIRYFPRANAAVISASGRLIKELLKDENIAVASAADIDAILFNQQAGPQPCSAHTMG